MTVHVDDSLIKGLINDDNKAISQIYSTCYNPVRSYICKNSGEENDARDIFQEAIMVVYDKAKHNQLNLTCSLKTYIFSIARLLWLKQLKKKQKSIVQLKEAEEYTEVEEDTIEIYNKNTKHALFVKHFKQLSKDCQKIISLFLDGKGIDEVTIIMNYNSTQHTKNRRYRCKKSLINTIRKHPDYKKLKNENYSENNKLPRW